MKSFIYKCFIGGSVALSMTLSSCLGDLDLKPIDDNVIRCPTLRTTAILHAAVSQSICRFGRVGARGPCR